MKLEIDLDFENISDLDLEQGVRYAAYELMKEIGGEIIYHIQVEVERRRKATASLVNFCNTGRFL